MMGVCMKTYCGSRVVAQSVAALFVCFCVVPTDVGSQGPPPTTPTADLALAADLQSRLEAAVGELGDAGDAVKAQWARADEARRSTLASAYSEKLSKVVQDLNDILQSPTTNMMVRGVAGQYEVAVKAIDLNVREVAGTALQPSPYATGAERAARFGLAPAEEEFSVQAMQMLILAERDPARHPLQDLVCTTLRLKSVAVNLSTGAEEFANTACENGRPVGAFSSLLTDAGATCRSFVVPKGKTTGDGRYSTYGVPNGTIQIFRPREKIFFMSSSMATAPNRVTSVQGEGFCRVQ
jgi:hypothetical protein